MELMPAALAVLMVLVMFGVVLAVWDIARRYEASEVAYLNWFLLHFSIGGLGLTAIVLMAALGKLTSEGVGTLLASVVAYSLGAATARGTVQVLQAPAERRTPASERRPGEPAPGVPAVPFPPVPVPAERPLAQPGGRTATATPPVPAQDGTGEPLRPGPVPRVPR